jgi:fucose permease
MESGEKSEPLARPERRGLLFAAACAGIFVFGIVLALLGTLFGLPEMRSRLHVDLAQQGDLLLMLFAGIFLATLIVGPVLDRFGNQPVLAISSVLVATALAGFSVARSFPAAAASSVLLGLGGGGLNTSTNVLVSDLYGEDRGPRLNILGIFFGIGALFIPLLAASISELAAIGQLLAFAASLAGVCVLAYALLRFPPPREAHSFSWREATQVVRAPGVLLFGALLFCQSGNEASIGGWVSTYIGRMGSNSRIATWILAGYWMALMLGRIMAARLLRRIEKARLILLSGLGSVAGAALLLVAPSVAVMGAATALIGLSFAAIYPTTLAMVGDRYPRFAGTVFGVLFSIALVGGGGFPWVIGQVSQSIGVRYSMLLPLLSAATICLLIGRIMHSQSGTAEAGSE